MSNVTIEYQKKLHKDSAITERMESQQRVYETLENLFNKILKTPFTGKILDAGCGDGALVNLLSSKENISAQGIDINHDIDFEKDKFPFKDNEFDVVIMYSVLEHLFDPGNILKEIRRITKPGGFLVIITSNFTFSNLLICDRKFYNDPTHVHPYNPVSIRTLMNLYNLEEVFIGLWTVKKSHILWKLPMGLQFYIGALLPFRGDIKWIPSFLKGRSKSMLCVFRNSG